MNEKLMKSSELDTPHMMNIPSAPPAYDDEFRPPVQNPPPYNPQVFEGQVQQAAPSSSVPSHIVPVQAPYPQQTYAPAPVPQYAGMPAAQVITHQTEHIFISNPPVGRQPMRMICPGCRANVTTRTTVNTDSSAHVCCLIMCLFVCWCCSCLPYCMDSFHSVQHHCPNCKAFLGTYHK